MLNASLRLPKPCMCLWLLADSYLLGGDAAHLRRVGQLMLMLASAALRRTYALQEPCGASLSHPVEALGCKYAESFISLSVDSLRVRSCHHEITLIPKFRADVPLQSVLGHSIISGPCPS